MTTNCYIAGCPADGHRLHLHGLCEYHAHFWLVSPERAAVEKLPEPTIEDAAKAVLVFIDRHSRDEEKPDTALRAEAIRRRAAAAEAYRRTP